MTQKSKQCLNCYWLEAREDREGRVRFWCIKKREDLGESVLWKKACEDFRE